MAEIEVQNSGWNSINGQNGGGNMGKVGSILSMIPTPVTQGIGAVMTALDSAHKSGGKGLLASAVSNIAGKPGGDAASFGNELSEAQGMFGDKNMNVGGLRTTGKTPTLGSMH